MIVGDALVLTYRDAAILGVGLLASCIAVFFWASRDRDNDRTTMWIVIAFWIGFALGWFGHDWYVSGALQ